MRIDFDALPEKDPSVGAWLVLRDRAIPDVVRNQAFDQLLGLKRGWWGNGTLLRFVRGVAFMTTRRVLRPQGFSVDQLDWEGLATEALLILFNHADRIEGHPASWLKGVLSNLVHREARVNWRRLSAESLERAANVASPQSVGIDAIDNVNDAACVVRKSLTDKLDPALQSVADLMCQGHVSRQDLGLTLGISQVALRKRIQRLRNAMTRELNRQRIERERPPQVRVVDRAIQQHPKRVDGVTAAPITVGRAR